MHKETNIKQDRENFAVQLRKDRREEAMKKRRKGFNKANEDAPDGKTELDIDVSNFTIDDAMTLQ